LLIGSSATATVSAETASADTSVPATWHDHSLIIDLDHLPKRYSCDQLWYKFRDVLLAVGAAAQMKIVPYRCGPRVGALAYSPKVQLRFSTPMQMSGSAASGASLRAVERKLRLQPGMLPHFDDDDCVLLSQMR
jgi:hypothetical protein